MNLEHLLETYGYAALFLGTFAEGESVLLLGGFLAHRGYLELPAVIATAFVAAACGDQLFFYIGRRHSEGFLRRFPLLHSKASGALRRIERNQVKVVLGMRFMWGLRIAMPIALGMTSMRASRFLWLNVVSAAIWAVLFAVIGFSATHVLARAIDGFHHYEKWIIGGLVILAAVILTTRWLRARAPEPAAPRTQDR